MADNIDKKLISQELLQIIPAVMRIVAAELRNTDIPVMTAHLVVLTALAPQSCNLSTLAELTAVSLPTMSTTISKMVEYGWVQRSRAEHDRRMIMLEITPKGQAVLQKVGEQAMAKVEELLQVLPPEDLIALQGGLAVMKKIFTPFEI
jgi:DNA-binding MarR family transcriptional regulator